MILAPVTEHRVAIGDPDADAGIGIEFLPLQRTEALHRREDERRFQRVGRPEFQRKVVFPGPGTRRAELLVVVAHFGLPALQPGSPQFVVQGQTARRPVELEAAEHAVVRLQAAVLGARIATAMADPEAIDVKEDMLDIGGNLREFHPLGRTLVTQVQAQAHLTALPVHARRHPEVHGRILIAQVLMLGHQCHVVGHVQAQRPVVVQ